MSDSYPFSQIEPKWQAFWEEHKTFRAQDADPRPKFYILDMFPYPSGAGLHVGHPEGYTATDIIARFKRMRGFNVLHPMGWDAFGLPAEQYAIETGTHPALTTRRNIETFKRQIGRLGFSYDWEREVDTTDPQYFKWTQWIFLRLHERGLAYLAEAPVWWCASCGTVLANEEVIEGKCERKGHPVERRPMRQWMLRITAYAERLLTDLEALDWPEHIKEQQRHWIGKSEGAEVWFTLEPGGPAPIPEEIIKAYPNRIREHEGRDQFKIFTTRPDTLFGATYIVMAPEHPLVCPMTEPAHYRRVVKPYVNSVLQRSELERADLSKEKTGVFTGAFAVNPVNQERIPIWIADYVLASYGTGAIMAVPAHDQRDFDFAKKYDGLPIRPVIVPEGRRLPDPLEQAFEEPGRMHDSGSFTGMRSEDAKERISDWLESRGLGKKTVNYKLRDWLFSRQRYWGEPIPVVHCKRCGPVPLPESELPLELPYTEDVRPVRDIFVPGTRHKKVAGGVVFESDVIHAQEIEAPLARVKKSDGSLWKETTCPKCKERAERETNTMPQWAGSCWYYLRYLDPHNGKQAWEPAKEKCWMPVDLYVGGAEHAVLHLLYARFWHKVLHDLNLVSTPEPFRKLVNQGLILGEDGEKMSKSRGNVVNPDDVIEAHGADAFRLYEMFMGPLEAVKPWNTRSLSGIDRFLNRVWRLGEIVQGSGLRAQGQADTRIGQPLQRRLHETIKRVTEDIEELRLNTAIAAMMELVNAMYAFLGSPLEAQPPSGVLPPTQSPEPRAALRHAFETLVLLLSPFAPHLCEELWQRLGHSESLAGEPWPAYESAVLETSEILLIVQVNGKVRARVSVPADASEDELKNTVLNLEPIKKFVDGQPIKQFIVVPKRLVSIVV